MLNTRLHNRGNGLLAVHASTENDSDAEPGLPASSVRRVHEYEPFRA
ncbi:hypothetical protein ARZXY2_4445 (plasmid) [Arthrobacter sp. ZXY-2]|nr:hypothetical protein ARZXY2_4445 [Arthrobacter sp. ZXY-2]